MGKKIVYLLWSNEHGMWHVAEGHGHTAEIEKAGRFGEGQALDAIVAAAHSGLIERAYVMIAAPECFG